MIVPVQLQSVSCRHPRPCSMYWKTSQRLHNLLFLLHIRVYIQKHSYMYSVQYMYCTVYTFALVHTLLFEFLAAIFADVSNDVGSCHQ
jgi:hypothetical protein